MRRLAMIKEINNKRIFEENEEFIRDLDFEVETTLAFAHPQKELVFYDKETPQRIFLTKRKTTDAILEPCSSSEVIGALNFASGKNAGGGYTRGASAQEEDLCRSSTLYNSLVMHQNVYEYGRMIEAPYYSGALIVSKDIVFRDSKYVMLQEDSRKEVIFISVAAPNLSNLDTTLQSHRTVYLNRALAILENAVAHKVDYLILGAWGCGVFNFHSQAAASLWSFALQKFNANDYFQVEFAIPDEKNFEIFKQVLVNHGNNLILEYEK